MINNIEIYLKLLIEEIKEKLEKDIDLDKKVFEDFNSFDFINFHLIYSYVLSDYNKDFFISLPDDTYKNDLYGSIFHSLVLIKLYQNFFDYEKAHPKLKRGDLIYSKKFNRVFVVLDKTASSLRLKKQFPSKKKDGNNSPMTITGHTFTKINPNLSNGRNTATNIDNYTKYLEENFDSNFPFITDFKKRALVIADKSFFKESKHLPIRYTNKNGKIKNDLPFSNYLIECCNDFKTANEFLLDTNQCFDELIIIGDSKYFNHFDLILQEAKFQGKVKRIILIGESKPDTPLDFIEWKWSNDEIKIANRHTPILPTKRVISNPELFDKLVDLKNEISAIENEIDVNLSFLLKYTSFYFKVLLVNSKLSLGVFQEYKERLDLYFKSEAFEEELHGYFYDRKIYNAEMIKSYTDRVFEKFEQISAVLEKNNLKWDYIKNLDKQNRKICLIVPKKNYDAMHYQIVNQGLSRIHLISDKRIDKKKSYLDKWLKEDSNSYNKIVVVPYLGNLELYMKLKGVKGQCEILCYEEIDELVFDKITSTYHNEEFSNLTHTDRKNFYQTEFSFDIATKKRLLDDLFAFEFNESNQKNTGIEGPEFPKEKVLYTVTFSDGSIDKFDSSKGVFLVENGEQIQTTIGEVYADSTIRFYQNTSPQAFKVILKIFDDEKLLETFDRYSESWKETLYKLSKVYNGIEPLFNRLFNAEYKINYNTFRLYFDENTQTRFPRIKTLEVIKNYCENNGFTEELIVKEFDNFVRFSKKDHSIRQQAGKLLGSDLIDYVASGGTEISESISKIPENILEKLTETIQQKTITSKTPIPYE
tara:strand:- start:41040 stop:43484 length:2445 start_codon:yes stop_codon:yes gene_type:complete